MAIRSMFFGSVNGDRKYTSDDFAFLISHFFTTGVLDGADNLRVYVNGNDRVVRVLPGGGCILGRFFFEDGIPEVVFNPSAADPVNNRFDRVIVKWDNQSDQRRVSILYREGIASVTPAPPDLIRDADEYEVSLCKVLVRAGSTTIVAGDLTDERDSASYCGRVKCTAPQLSENYKNINASGSIAASGDISAANITASGTIQGAAFVGAAASVHASQHASGGADPVTPAAIGAAASSHNHDASAINSGTLPISRGGTGATTYLAARAALHITYGTADPSGGTDGDIYFKLI